VTHTALVVLLGLVIWVYQKSNPTLGVRLQLWLGIVAGLLVAGMGLVLIRRAATGRIGQHHHHHEHTGHDNSSWFRKLFTHSHPHPHPPDPTHAHLHAHEQGHQHEHARDARPITVKLLVVLGVTGGIVPCPTATIIMLLGIGANVIPGALYAIAVFSLGLALTLMAIGFLALGSRRCAARLMSETGRTGELSGRGQRLMLQAVPALSGLVVFALGSAIAAHYIHYLRTGLALFSWIG
jgi:nickel/cobalt exporter